LAYLVSIKYARPSGHIPSQGFLGGSAIRWSETFNCNHDKEHALLLIKALDVIAYDCGTRAEEFPEIEGRETLIKDLFEQLWALLPEKYRSSGPGLEVKARADAIQVVQGGKQAIL